MRLHLEIFSRHVCFPGWVPVPYVVDEVNACAQLDMRLDAICTACRADKVLRIVHKKNFKSCRVVISSAPEPKAYTQLLTVFVSLYT